MQIYWNKRKRLHKKEFNSHRTGLGHQHGRRFIVLGHKYGRHDVMWKWIALNRGLGYNIVSIFRVILAIIIIIIIYNDKCYFLFFFFPFPWV